jgi:hypothetical protein
MTPQTPHRVAPLKGKKMTQHTPQPWTAERPADLRKPVVVSGPYGVIARFERGCSANIDLFLAAPDLLAACHEALACILKHVPATEFAPRDMLRAAIAKAEGR